MLVKLHFQRSVASTDEVVDKLEWYLAELWLNGQIHRGHLVSRLPVAAYVDVPRADALKSRFHSASGKKVLAELERAAGRRLTAESLETAPTGRARTWRSASSLYLFTHAFDTTSAVRAEDFEAIVPLFSLPISLQDRRDLQSWAEHHRDHDRLWLLSGRLELPAYRELADPRSMLAMGGKELCRIIEKATKKPTYYYLKRYYAHRHDEAQRACPGCGRAWSVRRTNPKATEFARFEFRCRRCRLVSHCGVSIDGARYARIGEFEGVARP